MQHRTNILFFFGLVVLLSSCSLTKNLGEDEYYLKSNKFEFKDKSNFKGELEDYVKQKPNPKTLGFLPLKDYAYNFSSLKYDSIFRDYYNQPENKRGQKLLDSLYIAYDVPNEKGNNYWILRKIYNAGKKPTILDSLSSRSSAHELEEFFFDRGYFDAKVEPKFDIDSTSKKASVTYQISIEEPSFIESYNQSIENSDLEKLYGENVSESKIKTGQRYDVRNFEDERERLTNIFKNNGYYEFNELADELIFKVDSADSKKLNVTLKIAKPKYDSIKEFKKHFMGDINIYADTNNPNEANYVVKHKGINILSKKPLKFKPRYFTDAVTLIKNDLYRTSDIYDTRGLILDRENLILNGIRIDKEANNEDNPTLISSIFLDSKSNYDFELIFEGMYSEFLNLGISPAANLMSRNVFGGGENLEFGLRGTAGTVNNDKNAIFNAYEISFETKLNFPRWLLPFNTEELVNKKFNPKSSVSLGLSQQKNIGLGSRNYAAIIDYEWSPGINYHKFELINFQFINNTEKDKYYRIFTLDNEIKSTAFQHYFKFDNNAQSLYQNGEISNDELELLIYENKAFSSSLPIANYTFDDYTKFRNMIFRKNSIIQDVLIQSFAHTYVYNENKIKDKKHPFYLYARAEVAGTLLRLANGIFNLNKRKNFFGKDYSLIGGVPYSEYVKFDLDIRKTIDIGRKSNIALRSFTGIAIPFGNLKVLPFSKSYFGGGSNDVRAWRAYELSASPLRPNDRGTYVDNLKITLNAEYRFPITSLINGALFVDAGNIWSTEKYTETSFKFNEFYKQFGIGSGFGLRLDFTYVVGRLDFAYKMHDPAYPEGERWFRDLKILKPQIQFGINYPF